MDKLGLDWRILLAQTVSFSIVFFVLWKFAYGPIFAMLNARREKIAEALANAEKIKGDVARTEVERQKILADAGDKANKLIDEARFSPLAKPPACAEQLRRKPSPLAEQIVIKAREAASQERSQYTQRN